jgi:hypothetical protein
VTAKRAKEKCFGEWRGIQFINGMQLRNVRIPSVDAAEMSPQDLRSRVAESIAKHEPLVIKGAFPFGIDVRRCRLS